MTPPAGRPPPGKKRQTDISCPPPVPPSLPLPIYFEGGMSGQSGGRKPTTGTPATGEEGGGPFSLPNRGSRKLCMAIKGTDWREGGERNVIKRSTSHFPSSPRRRRRRQWHAMIICLLCGDQLCQPTLHACGGGRSLPPSLSRRPRDLKALAAPTEPTPTDLTRSLGGGGGGGMQQLSIKGRGEEREGSQRDWWHRKAAATVHGEGRSRRRRRGRT